VLFRGRSFAESDVIHAVWEGIGGELVDEFVVPTIAGQLSRARQIDGVFAIGGPWQWLPAPTPLALRGRDVVICQAKAGQLNLGVFGQTLFAAELVQRQHAPRSLRLIAAAMRLNPLIERLPNSYAPFGRHIEHRTYPSLTPGRSSGATAPSAMRQALVTAHHHEAGGLLIRPGARRSRADFANVRAAASGEPLRYAEPDAIILPARRHSQATATTLADMATDEQVILVYTCTDLYMTTMGCAVFGARSPGACLDLRTSLRSFAMAPTTPCCGLAAQIVLSLGEPAGLHQHRRARPERAKMSRQSSAWNLSLDRPCQLVMTRMRARVRVFDGGIRASRVPPGVFWRLIKSVLLLVQAGTAVLATCLSRAAVPTNGLTRPAREAPARPGWPNCTGRRLPSRSRARPKVVQKSPENFLF
jgi:hypothetical protein